jgi:hypothetical protein
MQLSRNLVSVHKHSFLRRYHNARQQAFKPSNIATAFAKTGIHPFNPQAINPILFAPAKNTTTQSSQPLSTHNSSLLVPIKETAPTKLVDGMNSLLLSNIESGSAVLPSVAVSVASGSKTNTTESTLSYQPTIPPCYCLADVPTPLPP